MKNIGIFSLFLLLFLSSCRKDVNEVDVQVTTPNPIIEQYNPQVENITANVIGFVVDENGDPMPEATVKLNNQTFTTDAYGHFFINDATLNAKGTLVQIQKDGYFKGSRRFFPKEESTARIKIQMLKKDFNAEFSTADGGTITFGDSASVEFFPNSIRKENGDTYTGTVHVATQWLDPSSLATLDQMPGNLQGLNTQVEEVALATYGMIAVELEGDNGEHLNIKDGNTAKIIVSIPADLQANAPATIPLWSYNEEHGIWVQESNATLQDGRYVGEVSHFSFWNCDVYLPTAFLELTLVDDNGNPVTNVLVKLTLSLASSFVSGSGYTDQNGNVSGLIPANEELLLEVLDVCGQVLYTQNVGPFAADTDLGNITVASSMVNSTTVTGNLIDCDGNPITNGLVIASFGGQNVYHYPSTSNFSMMMTTCSSITDVEIIGVDLDSLVQSDVVIVPTGAQTDLGNVDVCGMQLEDYISITIDGVTHVYTPVSVDNNGAGWTYMLVENDDVFVGIGFQGIAPGAYPSPNNYIEGIHDAEWDINAIGGFTNLDVTEYGTNIIGTFSGNLEATIGGVLGTYFVSGEFNIVQ